LRRLLILALLGATSISASADAQTIIMRKVLGDALFGSGSGAYKTPQATPGTPDPTPTPTPGPTTTPGPNPVAGSWTVSEPHVIAPSCSAQAPATRDVWCAAANGDRLDDAACVRQGPKPSPTVIVASYEGCSYVWQPDGSNAPWTSTCSDQATRTRKYICQRSDGVAVDSSHCDATHQESETETAANLTGCTYEASQWQVKSYSSTCSSNSLRTTDATECVRRGGVTAMTVPIAQCAAAGVVITKTDTVEVLSGCSYVPTYSSTYGACVGGSQTAPIESCVRSDGTKVSNAECGSARQTTSRTCTTGSQCGVPAARTWTGAGATTSNTMTYSVGAASTAADAQAKCMAFIAGRNLPGVCLWGGNSDGTLLRYLAGTGGFIPETAAISDSNLRASVCR